MQQPLSRAGQGAAPLEAAAPTRHLPQPKMGAAPRVRLDYLDGLRAIAAVTVTIYHAFQIYGLGLGDLGVITDRGGLSTSGIDQIIFTVYNRFFHWGHFAVEVFIVISGYSLMIPLARSDQRRLPGGVLNFLKRRVRRILPPYYAAVLATLLLVAVVPGMNTRSNVYWDLALPAFDLGVIFSHVFLVHNLTATWHLKLNPPLWSIAVEWQIYLLFPVLIWLWRRFGMVLTLVGALVFGALPFFTSLPAYPLSNSWFLGLFSLGMFGAMLSFSQRPLLAMSFAAVFVGFRPLRRFGRVEGILSGEVHDVLLGFAVMCLLVQLARCSHTAAMHPPIYLRALQWSWLVRLGGLSYSLYLVHAPILALVALACRSLVLSTSAGYLAVFALGVPLAVLVSRLFFVVFEQPFLSSAARKAHQPDVVDADRSSAP